LLFPFSLVPGGGKNGFARDATDRVFEAMPQKRTVHPPQIAAWLVGLFIVEEQTDTQEQNHNEALSDSASTWGAGPARRWYRKQSAKTIAGHVARGFRTAPLLIVGVAFSGAFLLYLGTGSGYIEETILRLLAFFNHHVTPYHDSKGAAVYLGRLEDAVLFGILLESLIVGCLVAAVAKRREMIATMSLSFISLLMTVTIYWEAIAAHHVDPSVFPKIMIDQLGASLVIVIAGIIVRELRSAATRDPSRA
jgi:hypothetical protein